MAGRVAEHVLWIPRWHPARLNDLTGNRFKANRLKKADREMIWGYALRERITPAEGPRQVRLLIVLQPGQRGGDVDCYWKSTLDALKHANLLIDDSRKWVSLPPVQYQRGTVEWWGTRITLTDESA